MRVQSNTVDMPAYREPFLYYKYAVLYWVVLVLYPVELQWYSRYKYILYLVPYLYEYGIYCTVYRYMQVLVRTCTVILVLVATRTTVCSDSVPVLVLVATVLCTVRVEATVDTVLLYCTCTVDSIVVLYLYPYSIGIRTLELQYE